MAIDYSIPVLIVDDQEVMVDLVKQLVSKIGFAEIDHAYDAETALRMLHERKYQLVISDLHMKPMGGLQLLRAIRNDDRLKDTPFVMMTNDSSVPAALASKQGGADAYLLKPFTPQQLRANLSKVLSRR